MIEPTEDCPVHWLPPGSRRDAWWLFLATRKAENENETAPVAPLGSYRTMLRVWDECFDKILKIDSYGHHSKCTTCYRLKERMHTSASYADKLEASRSWCDHLERQWRDRMVYWRMRAAAERPGSTWLCIIIDGADQAKFRIMKSVHTPKNLETEPRPQMKIVGAMAHGHDLSFNFVEEDMPHNNNLTAEVLMRTLTRLLGNWNKGAGPATPFPEHLWLQVDNCGGENKSGHICKLLAALVDLGIFRSAVASYLQVGHTHEDIDFIFSVMSTAIKKMQQWDNPAQMAEAVQRSMTAHLQRTGKQMSCSSGSLDAVRDWKAWLDGYDRVHYKQGVEHINSCHWLCFLRRKDLPLDCSRAAVDAVSSPNDVMLMCKEFVSDSQLMQEPVVMVHAGASFALQPPDGPAMWEA